MSAEAIVKEVLQRNSPIGVIGDWLPNRIVYELEINGRLTSEDNNNE